MNLFGKLNRKELEDIIELSEDEEIDIPGIKSYILNQKLASYYFRVKERGEQIAGFLGIIGFFVCLISIYLNNSFFEGLLISIVIVSSLIIIVIADTFLTRQGGEKVIAAFSLVFTTAIASVIFYNPLLAGCFILGIVFFVGGVNYLKRYQIIRNSEVEYIVKAKIKDMPGKYLTHDEEVVRHCARSLTSEQK